MSLSVISFLDHRWHSLIRHVNCPVSHCHGESKCRITIHFVDPLTASGSTGPCSGQSTLINMVGKRNLNGYNVYLRWRSERETLIDVYGAEQGPGRTRGWWGVNKTNPRSLFRTINVDQRGRKTGTLPRIPHSSWTSQNEIWRVFKFVWLRFVCFCLSIW